ncbi:MAG: vitamin B12-dependent ribonucleotide reductase, partial [Planctomycetaceae bacterium]|nr:vitamin B12-dependent ribonucleotide reductase [Planctomycetaceae bacterium]
EAITAYLEKNDTVEGAPELMPDHLSVFDCAFAPRGGKRSIPWEAHVRMMAAAQPFLSGAISKTVNMPRESTPADIAGAYLEGWRLGLKALAVYRDGSKESQPLSTSSEGDKAADKLAAAPRRERLPDTRQSLTHKFNISGHEGYITVGLYDDGRPGELFITMAKEGSTIGGLMDCFGTAVSMSWQYGVPLEVYVNKFSHTRFEPMGFTKNPDIRIAKSIVDYIFRWLGINFIPGFREAHLPVQEEGSSPQGGVGDGETDLKPAARKAGGQTSAAGATPSAEPIPVVKVGLLNTKVKASGLAPSNGKHAHGTNGHLANGSGAGDSQTALLERAGVLRASKKAMAGGTERSEQFASFQLDAPTCDSCGAITVRNGNCYLCHNCGNSMGCS